MQINQKKVDELAPVELEKILKLFDSYHVRGGENLEKLKGKTVLYLLKHVSHIDYKIFPIILNQYRLNHPVIISGKNLDKESTKDVINEETGALFVDRYTAQKGVRCEKSIMLEEAIKNIGEILKKRYSILLFPQGTREYDKEPVGKIFTSFLKYIIREVMGQDIDVEVCCSTLNYIPHSYEEKFKKRLKKSKTKAYNAKSKEKEKKYQKFNKRYEKLDEKAYQKKLKKKEGKKGIILINIDEPFSLEEFLYRGGWFDLGEEFKKRINNLDAELQDYRI